MFYLIGEKLERVSFDQMFASDKQFVAVLTTGQWNAMKDEFDLGIDFDPTAVSPYITEAKENYDSITGAFSIPDRTNLDNEDLRFTFALDEKGIVLIDDSHQVNSIIESMRLVKRWRFPSLERFIYDLLDQFIHNDALIMETYEDELDEMERKILNNDMVADEKRLSKIRSDLRDLRIHYEQLIDLGEFFQENENHFFKGDNIRYFKLFTDRIEKLKDMSVSLRDYTVNIRELYITHLDIRENRIMTILTVVTTLFMPFSLITSWYGMNFKYMPELGFRYSYPVMIIASAVLLILEIRYFIKKKWL